MTTNISSDIVGIVISWLIIFPFIASLFLDNYVTDDRRHVFRLIIYFVSGFSSLILGFEMFTANIVNPGGGILDLSLFGYVLIGWTLAMGVCTIITLYELLSPSYGIAEGGQ